MDGETDARDGLQRVRGAALGDGGQPAGEDGVDAAQGGPGGAGDEDGEEERPGEEDELNALQRRLAFGYKVKSAGGNEACVALVAYGKRPLRICQRDKKWVALVEINGRECRLREIYVKAKGAMSVEYIELRGTATADGKQQKETIRP